MKVLELMEQHVGEEFKGVVTGITNFGLFIQIQTYLIDGLTRYDNLMDDWWEVDAKAGMIRGERSKQVIRIGDVVRVQVARVDLPRRELDLVVLEVLSRGTGGTGKGKHEGQDRPKDFKEGDRRTGGDKRAHRSKSRDQGKQKRVEKRKPLKGGL